MSQRYYGDITIVPNLGVEDYLNIVSNPTIDFLVDATLKGERATWPSKSRFALMYGRSWMLGTDRHHFGCLEISIIKNHCSIEHCIDDILYRLRLRRLEAYRAYPTMNLSVPKVSNNVAKTNGHADPNANPGGLGSSVSVCFRTIGRSSSSPASPTTSAALGMTRASPSPDHLDLDECARDFSTSDDNKPYKTTSQQDRAGPHSEQHHEVDSVSFAQPVKPALRRCMSGAAVGSGSSTTTSQRRPSIPNKPPPQSPLMAPSTAITGQRSGSISSTSSMSSLSSTASTSVSSVFAQLPKTEESELFQSQGKSLSMPSPSFTALSAASSPIPSIVHTRSTVRSSSKKSSSSSLSSPSSSGDSGTGSSSTSSASPGGNRSKRTKKFQMTSME